MCACVTENDATVGHPGDLAKLMLIDDRDRCENFLSSGYQNEFHFF